MSHSFRIISVGVTSIALALSCLFTALPCFGEAAEGVELFSQARFDEAMEAFEAVLADEDAEVERIATAHIHIAAIQLIGGDEQTANRHVRHAVALEPSIQAPDGSPLRLEELIEEASNPYGGFNVTIDLPSCPAAGAPVQTSAQIVGAPPGLVSSLGLRCHLGESSQEAELSDTDTIELVLRASDASPGESLACEAEARSSSGAVLRSRRMRVSLCSPEGEPVQDVVEAPSGAVEPDREGRTGLAVGLGVGLGTTVVAAVAVVLGVFFGTRPDTAAIGEIGLGGP